MTHVRIGDERKIVRHAAMGHSNELIAYELGPSPSPVATHRWSTREQPGERTRVELARRITSRP